MFLGVRLVGLIFFILDFCKTEFETPIKKYRKAEYVQHRVGFVNVQDVLG